MMSGLLLNDGEFVQRALRDVKRVHHERCYHFTAPLAGIRLKTGRYSPFCTEGGYMAARCVIGEPDSKDL